MSITDLKPRQVIGGTGNPPIKDAVVVIDGDKIVAVDPG